MNFPLLTMVISSIPNQKICQSGFLISSAQSNVLLLFQTFVWKCRKIFQLLSGILPKFDKCFIISSETAGKHPLKTATLFLKFPLKTLLFRYQLKTMDAVFLLPFILLYLNRFRRRKVTVQGLVLPSVKKLWNHIMEQFPSFLNQKRELRLQSVFPLILLIFRCGVLFAIQQNCNQKSPQHSSDVCAIVHTCRCKSLKQHQHCHKGHSLSKCLA